MIDNVRELRPKTADSEKITINLGYVDLGHIDLLVQEGFYSNRTDFIRTAIRNQLDRHNDAVKQSVARQQLDLGLRQYSRQDLEAVQSVRRDASHPGPRARRHRSGRLSRTGACNHCLHPRARRLASQCRGEGGAERPHPLTSRFSPTAEASTDPFREEGHAPALPQYSNTGSLP